MADEPISALSSTLVALTGNEVEILDVNDTTFASTGTNKRITVQALLDQYLIAGSNITLTPSGAGVTIASTASGGNGGLSSVGLSVPSWLTVTGSPLTANGTLAVTATTGEAANLVLATPNGSSGALCVRALVAADLPSSVVLTTGSYSAPSWLTSINGSIVSGNISGNAAGITGSITTSQVSNLSSWSGSTSITTVGTIGNGTWQGSAIGASYLTPPSGSGNIVYNNAGAFAASSQLSIESAGQLNHSPVTDPASPNAGDLWYSSAQNTFGFMSKGMITRAGGIIWQGLNAGTVLSNSTSQYSLLSGTYGPTTTLGSLTIPANALKPGTIIRPRFFGSMTQASGSPKLTMTFYLGSSVIWSLQSSALTADATAQEWMFASPFQSVDFLVQSIGSSGSVIGCASAVVGNGANNSNNLSCGTNSTTQTVYQTAPVPVTINTTVANTLDFQVAWSAASASNSMQFLGGYIAIDG